MIPGLPLSLRYRMIGVDLPPAHDPEKWVPVFG